MEEKNFTWGKRMNRQENTKGICSSSYSLYKCMTCHCVCHFIICSPKNGFYWGWKISEKIWHLPKFFPSKSLTIHLKTRRIEMGRHKVSVLFKQTCLYIYIYIYISPSTSPSHVHRKSLDSLSSSIPIIHHSRQVL